MFVEGPINCLEHDIMGEIARGTHLPIATGERITVCDGYLDLPTGAGLGIELDENAMSDKIRHDWRNQESYDTDDGSVEDW